MLLAHALKVRRFAPTPFLLVSTCVPPFLTRFKIQHTFPAKLLAEHRTQFLCSIIDRTYPVRPRPFILVVRKTDGVVILHAFPCALGGVQRISKIISKARGAGGINTHRRLHFSN